MREARSPGSDFSQEAPSENPPVFCSPPPPRPSYRSQGVRDGCRFLRIPPTPTLTPLATAQGENFLLGLSNPKPGGGEGH